MTTRSIAATLILVLATLWSAQAAAFTVTISGGPRELYLRVGDGVFTSTHFNAGGRPGSGGAINLVSVNVPAAAVGNGSVQAMTGNASQLNSNYDGFAFCNSGQIYVGGYYRGNFFNAGTATLTVNTPTNLTTTAGDTIAFSQISWISSGNGDTGAQPIPSGSFSGGQQALATFNRNSWNESCLSFRYANANFVAAGQYRGRATYTLSSP